MEAKMCSASAPEIFFAKNSYFKFLLKEKYSIENIISEQYKFLKTFGPAL
jgi:hypothetical protein